MEEAQRIKQFNMSNLINKELVNGGWKRRQGSGPEVVAVQLIDLKHPVGHRNYQSLLRKREAWSGYQCKRTILTIVGCMDGWTGKNIECQGSDKTERTIAMVKGTMIVSEVSSK